MSIYDAVADQTIAGRAQGRPIEGNVIFLGGPLFFLQGLRAAFQKRLGLSPGQALFPPDAEIFVAKGAAFSASGRQPLMMEEIRSRIANADLTGGVVIGEPLFHDGKEYQAFLLRHKDFAVRRKNLSDYEGSAYLGIDAGSTTTKMVLLADDGSLLYSNYEANHGLPIEAIVRDLREIYAKMRPGFRIAASAVTGYGEDLIRSSVRADYGIVETVAHFKAARYFEPDVDFVLDIGGQDIKCFRVRNGAIDSIMLNEACSSGCGSFLQSFANALGYEVADFAKLGLFATHPVELGSRCTVFMNSSVKEAQRDGATLADISAGLSKSVVKNALYKVIRVNSFSELGSKIVCQGGTFLNDAVLRAFEMEIGHEVLRPSIAGLMGAFGAALYAKERGGQGNLITKDELERFAYSSRHFVCQGCTTHCNLTLLSFPDHRHYVSGNRCDKPEGRKDVSVKLDIYPYKKERLLSLRPQPSNPHSLVGLPLALVMYEQLPLWDVFFKELGFAAIVSPFSSRELYREGQSAIPSDTVCYPAKLKHGHVRNLFSQGADFVFYPSESYNIDEKRGDNHFNCPVLAYYGELIRQNGEKDRFLDPFIDLNHPRMAAKALAKALKPWGVGEKEAERALMEGLKALKEYRDDVMRKGAEILSDARSEGKRTVILAGRPYHLDPEVSHGLDEILASLGFAVITEDSISCLGRQKLRPDVLNQWTYHARLYDAAAFAAAEKDVELVQLVSFGCGVDAITSDEVRSILEKKGKLYTQLKIDEISNLGAARIRLRSLKAALDERDMEIK
jgi:predicted CoA-substrate-specific enzyme activase